MSVSSALRILDAFHESPSPMTLSELSRRTGIPLTSTHRVVGQLREWGALERDEEGCYRVGLRLWEVAAQAPRAVGLKQVVMPYMQDLYEVVHLSLHLAVREGDHVVFIERFTSATHHSETPRLGVHYPLHATAVGLLLLAHAPREIQTAVLTAPLEPFTEFTYTDAKELRRALADVRRTGYAVSDRQFNPDLVAVAAPISDRGGVVAAISLIVPSQQWSAISYPELLRATARGISRGLGARLPADGRSG